MGSIVFYKGSKPDNEEMPNNRDEGMIHAGKILSEFLKNYKFRKAIRKTIQYFSNEDNGYSAFFEYIAKGEGGLPKRRKIKNLKMKEIEEEGRRILIADLYKGKNYDKKKGTIVIDIYKDIDKVKNNDFAMNIAVPRRAEKSNSWTYLGNILKDIDDNKPTMPKDPDEGRKEYLKALVMFSRCR